MFNRGLEVNGCFLSGCLCLCFFFFEVVFKHVRSSEVQNRFASCHTHTVFDGPALIPPVLRNLDDFSQSEKRVFSRASMNLQSPGMDSLKGLDPGAAPMPDFPKPPSPTPSAVSATMKTPSTITNPVGRISDASPMYDRAAIARAMVRHEIRTTDTGVVVYS